MIEPELLFYTFRLALRSYGNKPVIIDISLDGYGKESLLNILFHPDGMKTVTSRKGTQLVFDSDAVLYAYDLGNSWTGDRDGVTIE